MPQGEKNKLTKEQREEIVTLQGKESGHKVAEKFGVSHTAIYKLWRKKGNQLETKTIDSKIIQKLFKFFANPAVRGSIPENLKDTLMASLTEGEQARIQKILRGVFNE